MLQLGGGGPQAGASCAMLCRFAREGGAASAREGEVGDGSAREGEAVLLSALEGLLPAATAAQRASGIH